MSLELQVEPVDNTGEHAEVGSSLGSEFDFDDLSVSSSDGDDEGDDVVHASPLDISPTTLRRVLQEFEDVNPDLSLLVPLRTLGHARVSELLEGPPWRALRALGVRLPGRYDLSDAQERAYDDGLFDRDVLDMMKVELMAPLQLYARLASNVRRRLTHFSSLEALVDALKTSSQILVITGAGISTSLGIPDFRSAGGIYDRLDKYSLSDPQEMFDIRLFREDPSIFCDFAKELLPEHRGYSPTHAFIRLLQDKGKLLRNYTQNIDDIESTAGVVEDKLVQCHGSFRTATCLKCGWRCDGKLLFGDLREGKVPRCPKCQARRDAPFEDPLSTAPSQTSTTNTNRNRKRKRSGGDDGDDDDDENDDDDTDLDVGVMKPDIVFFGEQLPEDFRSAVLADAKTCDLCLCVGTSLRVAPVADVPLVLPADVPQALINRDPLRPELAFDVQLLGASSDLVVTVLAHLAGWGDAFEALCAAGDAGTSRQRSPVTPDHIYSLEAAFIQANTIAPQTHPYNHIYVHEGQPKYLPKPLALKYKFGGPSQHDDQDEEEELELKHWPTVVEMAIAAGRSE
ncbi:NAD-dependent histone deacetylase sir2 [Savitreella phatthalungensis]